MDSKTKNVIIGAAAFAVGYVVGDCVRQFKVADKIVKLYKSGGYIAVPADDGDMKDVFEVEYTVVE